MSTTMESLGIDRLSVSERLALVQEIWDSIAAESTVFDEPTDLLAELDRRIAEDDAHPDATVPWAQVRTEILAKLKTR